MGKRKTCLWERGGESAIVIDYIIYHMSAQQKIDEKQEKIHELQSKYDQSSSPDEHSAKRNVRRVKSGVSMKQFKVNQNNFLKNPKELLGGGTYKRSEVLPATSFPQIHPNNSNRIPDSNTKMRKGEDSQSYHFKSLETMDFFKQTLGSQHHCHFESQVKQLLQQLEVSDQLAQRARDEMEKIIWMVKNYNNEGLVSRLMELQKLKNDLEQNRMLMKQEIDMLGLQRDDWQNRYQEINEKLLKMQGLEKELEDTKHKLHMSNESLEQINKRLREKNLEVQDWQRKCNTHDEQYKKRIQGLEQTLKEMESQASTQNKRIVKLENENIAYQGELRTQKERLDEETRRGKQLHAELLDTRVNKVQNLQDEIAKHKKTIQQRVEEIEEQERKIRQLNSKIQMVETQLKSYDDVARAEKEELERTWQKKYKELETISIKQKRDINSLEIQIQQNDLLTQQKEQEVEQAIAKINELEAELTKEKSKQEALQLENQKQAEEIRDIEEELGMVQEEKELIQLECKTFQQQIESLENERSQLKQAQWDTQKKLEQLQGICEETQRQNEKIKDQLEAITQNGNKLRDQLDAEVKKNQDMNRQLIEYNQKMEFQKAEYEQEKEKAAQLVQEKEKEIKRLKHKIDEYEDQDKDLVQKISNLEKQIEELKKNKLQQEQDIIELSKKVEDAFQKELSMDKQLKEKEDQLEQQKQRMQEIQDDKTEENRLNKLVQELQKELEAQKKSGDEEILTLRERNQSLEKENKELKEELERLKAMFDDLKRNHDQLNEQHKKAQQDNQTQVENLKETQKHQMDLLEYQLGQNQKKLAQLNDQYQEALDKIELLEEAIENSKGKDFKMPAKQEKHQLQKTNTFREVFVEDKLFKDSNEAIDLQFSDLVFVKGAGHLAVSFWIKIDKTNSQEQLPIMRITARGLKLLELGVHLESKQIYSTYIPNNHPQNKKRQAPITVTSQLSIKLGIFQQIALIMTESGVYMDMGLCLNGTRDDQVSLSSTLILPEAQLTFGRFSQVPFVIKDAVVLTKEIPSLNIYKEVYQQFFKRYNNILDKPPSVVYASAGDLLLQLIQYPETFRNKSPRHKSKSPPQMQTALVIKDKVIPAALAKSYDRFQKTSQTETKQDEPPPEPVQWTRKRAVDQLKDYLFKNFNFKGLLRPIIDYYDYVCMGLQYLQPARDSDTHCPSKFHKAVKPQKILTTPFYVIPFQQFCDYLDYVVVLKVSRDDLKQICNETETIFQFGNQDYLHYDHFMLALRECIMTRAELQKRKKQELQAEVDDPESELEMLQLPPVPDSWNQGRFYINIMRCTNCKQHQTTTQHSEEFFFQKAEQVTAVIKEMFPNAEIVENEVKPRALEMFEVYIKFAGGKDKTVLLAKKEYNDVFEKVFESRLPQLYFRLITLINFHQTTEKLGQEQEKLQQIQNETLRAKSKGSKERVK